MKITILLTYILIVILGIIITMDKNTFPLAKPIGFTLFSSIFIMYLTQRIDLLKLMLNKLIFKGYMTLGLRKNLIIRKNVQYKTSDLIAGVSKIPLENVELRIIAYNIERGEYATGSGKTMEIHTINTPVNGIMIYSEKVQHISENVNISNYFKGNIIFDRLYENLYPELIVGKSNSIMGKDNGIILQCEIQLICDKLIDQKLILSSVYFEQDDFTF